MVKRVRCAGVNKRELGLCGTCGRKSTTRSTVCSRALQKKMKKTLNGRPAGASPGVSAVKEFFEKVDNDPDWYPGKLDNSNMGRPERPFATVRLGRRSRPTGRAPARRDELPSSSAVLQIYGNFRTSLIQRGAKSFRKFDISPRSDAGRVLKNYVCEIVATL